jgi:DNA polymerase-1
MGKKLYIIDGHAHIYAAYYAQMRPLTSPSGEPTKATYVFTTVVLSLIKSQSPDMLVVVMDSKTPSFRTKIYPEYKAHRPPMPPDMPVQIDRIEAILRAMRIPVLRIESFEADDLIGTLARDASAKGIDTFICSKDKDMLQLLDKHIFTYDIKTGLRTDAKSMFDGMKVTPKQFVDCLALQGDASDNVPGVPDVGPKTALEWIQKYHSLKNLFKHAGEIKGKRGESLRKSSELVLMCKKLVTINCNAPVKIDYDNYTLSEPDKEALAEIFTELGFNRLLAQIEVAQTGTAAAEAVADSGAPDSVKTVKHDYQLIDTEEKFDKFLAELAKQKRFALDTETTSILPLQAELVGMSFSWQRHKAFYLPSVRRKLGGILRDENVKKIGQNIKYDLLVLQGAGMPVKGVYFDTMVASYCLDAERKSNSVNSMGLDFLNYRCIPISVLIGKGRNQLTFDMVDIAAACEYAAEDADITFRLYEYLKGRLEKEVALKRLFEEVEMPLVVVLAAMEFNGVSLDTSVLRKMSGEITGAITSISERIYELAGTVFNIDSPKQLGEILFDNLHLQSTRIGKAGRSTNADVLERLRDEHAIIDLILQYRQLSKLKNTYVDKLGSLINPRTSRVHASFNQTITATGRLSSSGPNLQNIPIRTELGKKIRSAFVPKTKSDVILSADYSQVELRLLAHFSKDKALSEAFAAEQDIHRFVASQIYDVPIDKVTGEMRSSCKAVNFGIIYGQGAFGLSRSIGISHAEAKKFIKDYFSRYKSIRQFMNKTIAEAKRTGYVETICRRRRRIADINSKNANKRSQAERFAINTVIQGSAADLIKVAMINIQRRIKAENLPVKMILQIHDELVFELPAVDAKQYAGWIGTEMTTAIQVEVPLKVDISFGPTWLSNK